MNLIITQRHNKDKYNCDIEVLESAYVKYFETFGIKLIIIPNSTSDIKKYFSNSLQIQGVILSGGNNINPVLYGKKKNGIQDISNKRDKVETTLIDIAVKKKIPVLGICRGMQMINVYFGGKLNNNINQVTSNTHKPGVKHNIKLKDKKLIKQTGKTSATVNSYHNQGILIDEIGNDLEIFALDKNEKVIEGLYHKKLPVAGIQWHPEREKNISFISKFIITAFIRNKLYWKK